MSTGPHLQRIMASDREHYIWHVEQRDGRWMAVHQHGGWLKFNSPEAAQASIDKSVERYGDTDRDASRKEA